MKLTIDVSEKLMKDIRFEAEHENVSVDEWLKKIIKQNVWRREVRDQAGEDHPHIADFIADLMKDVDPEDLAMLPDPRDLDHYLYGTPKRSSGE